MEDIEETDLEVISFNDLDEDLKERVRDYYRNDDFIPNDWYEHIVEDFSGNTTILTIDDSTLEFDMYHNSFNIKGEVDRTNSEISGFIGEKLEKYINDEWVYDISDSFVYSDGMNREFYVDEDLIHDEIENDFFGDNNIEVVDDNIELDIDTYKETLKHGYEKHNDLKTDISIVKEWLSEMEANELFFQSTITISETDYDNLLSEIREEIVQEIHSLVETFFDDVNSIITETCKKLHDDLKGAYDFYSTDEYVDGMLEDMEYEVEIDSDGNQLEIIDLNGV